MDTTALLAKIPAISARRGDLATLYGRLKTLLDRSPRARLLSTFKYAAYIVLLINFGSLPFVWHSESLFFFLLSGFGPGAYGEQLAQHVFLCIVRVLWPIIATRLEFWVLQFKLAFASKKERTHALTAWAENLSPVGANPFEFSAVYKRWASASLKSIKIHSMRTYAV